MQLSRITTNLKKMKTYCKLRYCPYTILLVIVKPAFDETDNVSWKIIVDRWFLKSMCKRSWAHMFHLIEEQKERKHWVEHTCFKRTMLTSKIQSKLTGSFPKVEPPIESRIAYNFIVLSVQSGSRGIDIPSCTSVTILNSKYVICIWNEHLT